MAKESTPYKATIIKWADDGVKAAQRALIRATADKAAGEARNKAIKEFDPHAEDPCDFTKYVNIERLEEVRVNAKRHYDFMVGVRDYAVATFIDG